MKKYLNDIASKMYLEGQNDENFVMAVIEDVLGGSCTKSSKQDDTSNHIDFWWDSPKKGLIGIDVKGRRKKNRQDTNYDDEMSWIELLNVRGKPGWVYGKSHYIAFRFTDKIIFVQTDKLRQFSEEKIKGKETVYDTPNDFYIPYQRKKYGRKDLMIKVPTIDLMQISSFIIYL